MVGDEPSYSCSWTSPRRRDPQSVIPPLWDLSMRTKGQTRLIPTNVKMQPEMKCLEKIKKTAERASTRPRSKASWGQTQSSFTKRRPKAYSRGDGFLVRFLTSGKRKSQGLHVRGAKKKSVFKRGFMESGEVEKRREETEPTLETGVCDQPYRKPNTKEKRECWGKPFSSVGG